MKLRKLPRNWMLSDHDDVDPSKSNNSNVDGICVWRAHKTSLHLPIYFLSKPRILKIVRLGFKDEYRVQNTLYSFNSLSITRSLALF